MLTIDEEPKGIKSTWRSSYPYNIRSLVGHNTLRKGGGHPNQRGHQLISDFIRANVDKL